MSRNANRLLTAGGLTGILLAAAVAPAMAATPSPALAKAGCASGSVPTSIAGNPGIKAQAPLGVYLGHDKAGYELKVTHPLKTKTTFTGTLTASKGFSKLDKQRLEGKDFATLSADRKVLTFRFVNYGGIDGIHIGGDCSSTIAVNFKINGTEATTSQVFLGKSHLNPTSVPFTLDRSKSAAGTTTTPPSAAVASQL